MVARYVVTIVTEDVSRRDEKELGYRIEDIIEKRLIPLLSERVYFDVPSDAGELIDEKNIRVVQVKVEYEP